MRSAGDRLWIGIPGPTVDAAGWAHLESVAPGGIILFRRNIVDEVQTRDLVADLRDRLGPELHVVVDQEGGAVVRFERECTVFPGNLALGAVAAADRTRGLALARAQGRVSARELRALGIDGNLAPVCDLTVRVDNPGVGARSFGGDPVLAGDLARELVTGHLEGGVLPTLKHFPGLGAADRDSHHALPRVAADDVSRHLEPFRRAIAGGAPRVMTAHLVHEGLDPEAPVTTSPRVVREVLRGRLRFEGVVITDDLEMGAIDDRPIEARIAAAVAAEHDILCVCHDPDLQRRARDELDRLGAGDDPAVANRLDRERSAQFRSSTPIPSLEPGGASVAEDGPTVARAIAEEALTLLRRGAAPPVIPDGERWLLILPTLRRLSPAEDPLRAEDLRPLAEALGERVEVCDVGAEPSPEEMARAARAAVSREGILLPTIGLPASEPRRQLLLSALEWQPRTVVIPLGDPGELAALPARDFTAITAYGYRRPHQLALARALLGEIEANGRWPVSPAIAAAARLEAGLPGRELPEARTHGSGDSQLGGPQPGDTEPGDTEPGDTVPEDSRPEDTE